MTSSFKWTLSTEQKTSQFQQVDRRYFLSRCIQAWLIPVAGFTAGCTPRFTVTSGDSASRQINLPNGHMKACPPATAPLGELPPPVGLAKDQVISLRFHTRRLAPNHLVTLHTDVDGWDFPIYGTYYTPRELEASRTAPLGYWLFQLPWMQYQEAAKGQGGLKIRFVLDQVHPMKGEPISLTTPSPCDFSFDESSISFSATPRRFLHGHDNLHTFETPVQQNRFRANRNEQVPYDVIVIGSGMSGGILADELSDKGAKVLVLEAGSVLFPTHMYNLPGSWFPLKDRYFVYQHVLEKASTFGGGVKINFGGGAVFWSGIIQQAREWEFGAWPASVREYLLRQGGYQRALELMRKQMTLGPYQEALIKDLTRSLADYRVEDLPRARHQPHLAKLPGGRLEVQNVIRETNGMFSTADLLLDSMSHQGPSGNENLTINLNHMVTAIETRNGRATSVVCEDLIGNKTRRYRADTVVLAAGSLGSTRIALQSNLENAIGLIGRGLTDHPHFEIQVHVPARQSRIKIDDHAKLMLWHKDAAHGRHPYNIELLVNYEYWDTRLSDEDIWRQHVIRPKTDINVTLQFFFSSPLGAHNYVKLDRALNKLVVYTERNDGGRAYEEEIRRVANKIFAELGVGEAERKDAVLKYFGGAEIGHSGGTLRMGERGAGVVDEMQRFLPYENLYVADLSVFPSILAAKPSLTLAALSLRLADTILARPSGLRGRATKDVGGRRVERAALVGSV